MKWYIYIPEEGDWVIKYKGKCREEARKAYLKWAGRKRLPAGAYIWSSEERGYVYRGPTRRKSCT